MAQATFDVGSMTGPEIQQLCSANQRQLQWDVLRSCIKYESTDVLFLLLEDLEVWLSHYSEVTGFAQWTIMDTCTEHLLLSAMKLCVKEDSARMCTIASSITDYSDVLFPMWIRLLSDLVVKGSSLSVDPDTGLFNVNGKKLVTDMCLCVRVLLFIERAVELDCYRVSDYRKVCAAVGVCNFLSRREKRTIWTQMVKSSLLFVPYHHGGWSIRVPMHEIVILIILFTKATNRKWVDAKQGDFELMWTQCEWPDEDHFAAVAVWYLNQISMKQAAKQNQLPLLHLWEPSDQQQVMYERIYSLQQVVNVDANFHIPDTCSVRLLERMLSSAYGLMDQSLVEIILCFADRGKFTRNCWLEWPNFQSVSNGGPDASCALIVIIRMMLKFKRVVHSGGLIAVVTDLLSMETYVPLVCEILRMDLSHWPLPPKTPDYDEDSFMSSSRLPCQQYWWKALCDSILHSPYVDVCKHPMLECIIRSEHPPFMMT